MSEPKGPGGRPTKFIPEHKEKLLEAIRKGAPYELACNYARIDYTTFLKWRVKADIDKEPDFVEFFRELKAVEGETSLRWLAVIDKAMDDGTWQAGAWKLERRHNKYFSPHAGLIEMNERLAKLESGEHKNETRKEEAEEE